MGILMVNSFAVDISIFPLPQGLVHLDFFLYFARGRGERSNQQDSQYLYDS